MPHAHDRTSRLREFARPFAALTLVVTMAASPAPAQSPTPASSPSATPAPSLQAILDQRTSSYPGSGLIVAQIGPQGVVVTKSGSSGTARPIDEHSLFEIGSVTKTFTATILATMVLDGSVKLDDPVAMYLPKTVHVPTHNGKVITLLNLATQHSGLPRLPTNLTGITTKDPYAHYSVADMYEFLSHYTLTRDPGATFEYSNYGVALLGQALANREHTTYAELLQRRVLGPLGMNDTTLTLTAAQRPRFTVGLDTDNDVVSPWTFASIAPAGALHSTIADMLKYARCNMGHGPLARACLFAQMPRSNFPLHKIGLVWWTSTQRQNIIHHGGDTFGYHASIAISADHTLATIALANGGLPVEDIALHTMDPTIPIAQKPASLTLDSATLDAYVGTYASHETGLTMTVARKSDTLTIQLTGQQPSSIYATSKDEFVSHIVDARFKFVRGDDGKPTALVLAQNGQTIVFVRPGATAPPASAIQMFPPVVDLGATVLQDYVGEYASSVGTFYVTRDGDQLLVRLEGQSALDVYPSAKDAFFYKIITAQIDFGRDASGKVTTLTLHQGGQNITATRK